MERRWSVLAALGLGVAVAGACGGGVKVTGTTSTGTGTGAHGGASTTSTGGAGGTGGTAVSSGSTVGSGGGATSASSSGTGGATTSASSTGGSTTSSSVSSSTGAPCPNSCSPDYHSVIDCHGNVVLMCSAGQGCDPTKGLCVDACTAVESTKQSVGCEFYATDMDQYGSDLCFAAFVANTWNTPVHISVDFAGTTLPVQNFTRIPMGSGPSLTYAPYDPVGGLPPGQVAILFLAGSQGTPGPGEAFCPVPTAMPTTMAQILQSSGLGHSFRISTDAPAVAYEMNPYGGGSAAVTAGSLLLPTSAWDTNYVAVTVTPFDLYGPSMNIIASQDATTVTMFPKVAVAGGGGLPAGPAMTQYKFMLNKGQMAQFTQNADLTGSVIQSDKPIGFMAGQPCMRWPTGVAYCDHGEQMVPPVSALGSEYVGVMWRPRVSGDHATWRLVGTIDGTTLTYSTPVGGPATLNAGQVVTFDTATPFDVKSQDAMHPFMMFTYMSGSQASFLSQKSYGDPDMVLSVPPQQYQNDYVFFTDPTYPETNLVIVRDKNAMMGFDDVTLDCAGVLTGWQPVGNYEWTRIDLSTGNFMGQNGCNNGRHEIKSATPFGLWVWGWGTPVTTTFTANVSYGYPGGMSLHQINTVVIPPTG